MTIRYEVVETPSGEEVINAFLDNGIMLSIPKDESNSDYQRYLRHLAGEDENGTIS